MKWLNGWVQLVRLNPSRWKLRGAKSIWKDVIYIHLRAYFFSSCWAKSVGAWLHIKGANIIHAAFQRVKILSFQISIGSLNFRRVSFLCQRCMEQFYVCFQGLLYSFKTSLHLLQLFRCLFCYEAPETFGGLQRSPVLLTASAESIMTEISFLGELIFEHHMPSGIFVI